MGKVLQKSAAGLGSEAQYNAHARDFLHNRYLLAMILKGTLAEVRELSVTEIAERCMEPADPENPHWQMTESGTDEDAGKSLEEPVPETACRLLGSTDIPEKIVGQDTVSGMAGRDHTEYFFDVCFAVNIPDGKRLLIDMEPQKKFDPGYEIVTRGIFYGALKLTDQSHKEFTGEHYDDLKKVVSIWICMNAPLDRANTISVYEMKKHDLEGTMPDRPEIYDKLTVIQICLNAKCESRPGSLIRLLNMIFSDGPTPEERKRVLQEEFGFLLEEEGKEVLQMCAITEYLLEEGEKRGREEGREEGIEQLILDNLEEGRAEDVIIGKLMRRFSLDYERAMEYFERYADAAIL